MLKNYYIYITSLLIVAIAVPLVLQQSNQPQEIRQRAQSAAGTNLYVAPNGNGDCSQASPCSLSAANTKASPGTTILAASGIYNGNFATTKGGAPGNFITFRSQAKHGATIVGGGKNTAVDIRHEYVRFQDFTITGAETRNGFLISANNVEIIGNHIHTITQFLTGGTSWEGGAGIDTGKPQLSNILIDSNIIHNVGLASSTQQLIHGMYLSSHVTNGRVTNNVIYEVEDFGLHPYDETEASGWHFINNTVAFTGRGILQAPNGVTRNNVVYNTKGASYDIRGSGNVLSNNISGGTGGVSMAGVTSGVDPMFVNATSRDFHLQPGSPALDKGIPDGAPTTDAEGRPRPQGAGVDIGAYEVGAAGANPTVALSPAPSTGPTLITPTIFCVGGAGTPPCAPLNPTISVAPTGGSGSVTPVAPTPTGGANPTTVVPQPTTNPCKTGESSVLYNKKKKTKPGGGFIELFLKFFMMLIEWLLSGGQFPPVEPNPGTQPTPTPDPTPSPCPSTQPTTAPAEPTPDTATQQPSQPTAAQTSPTTITTNAVTPESHGAKMRWSN